MDTLHLSKGSVALLICSLLSIDIFSVRRSLFYVTSSSRRKQLSIRLPLWQQGWSVGYSSPGL